MTNFVTFKTFELFHWTDFARCDISAFGAMSIFFVFATNCVVFFEHSGCDEYTFFVWYGFVRNFLYTLASLAHLLIGSGTKLFCFASNLECHL